VIRALILDWGGVIQRTEDPAPRRALAARLGLSPRELERAVFGSVAWQRASIGEVSADAAWRSIAENLGWPADSIDDLVERFFAGDRLDTRLIALVRHLRAEGVRVGLLSNALPARSADSGAGRWGMEGLFDAQVFSYQVGVLKPHPAAYRAVLDALQVAAGEALFVDDAAENVVAARAEGLHALLFSGTDALLSALRRHGLPVPSGV